MMIHYETKLWATGVLLPLIQTPKSWMDPRDETVNPNGRVGDRAAPDKLQELH